MADMLGSYNTSGTRTHVGFQFTTHAASGAAVAPSTGFESADIRAYKATDGAAYSATQRSSSSGITLTSPFDSVTGLHDVDIDLTDNTDVGFWAAGSRYSVVLSPDTETVDSLAVVRVLAYFEIGPPQVNVTQWNALTTVALPLIPTTAGRTLDVSTTGEAGVDWANVGSPTTSLALTGTTIAVTQKVDVDTIKTNPVVNGGTLTFPTTATLASTTNITAGTVTTASNVTTVNDKTGYALTAGERNSTADALLDRAAGIETGLTLRQALRLIAAACAGLASGLAGTTATYKSADISAGSVQGTTSRIVATVDADGNRTAITVDLT